MPGTRVSEQLPRPKPESAELSGESRDSARAVRREAGSGGQGGDALRGAPGPWAGSGADEGGRGTGGVGGAGAAQPAAGERALSRLSHAGRERRVAACAQTVPLHCGFGEPRLLRSQHSLGVRCAPLQGRAALLS